MLKLNLIFQASISFSKSQTSFYFSYIFHLNNFQSMKSFYGLSNWLFQILILIQETLLFHIFAIAVNYKLHLTWFKHDDVGFELWWFIKKRYKCINDSYTEHHCCLCKLAHYFVYFQRSYLNCRCSIAPSKKPLWKPYVVQNTIQCI